MSRIRIGALALLATTLAAPVSAQTFVKYSCADGTQISAAFFTGDKRVHMQLDGKAVVLPQRISASGARYAKRGVSFWVKGQEATLKRPKAKTTMCRAD
jgi:membrane-bound inhibitor of C-type lysozyme